MIDLSTKYGLSPEDCDEVMRDPSRFCSKLPESQAHKDDLLKDMVSVLVIDGNADETEVEMLSMVDLATGYSAEQYNIALKKIM